MWAVQVTKVITTRGVELKSVSWVFSSFSSAFIITHLVLKVNGLAEGEKEGEKEGESDARKESRGSRGNVKIIFIVLGWARVVCCVPWGHNTCHPVPRFPRYSKGWKYYRINCGIVVWE